MARSEADNQGGRRAREARGMYQNFLIYASGRVSSGGKGVVATAMDRDTAVQTALQFFGKWELYRRILYAVSVKNHVNSLFTGKLVAEWTSVHGPPVRWIMDEVKRRLGGDEVDKPPFDTEAGDTSLDVIDPLHWTVSTWQVSMETMDITAVRNFTIQVKEEMDKNGQLAFDWREAKRRQIERKKAMASGQLIDGAA